MRRNREMSCCLIRSKFFSDSRLAADALARQVPSWTRGRNAPGRFARHFDADGKPDEFLNKAQQDRLENWRRLQELAGLR